MKLVIAIVQDEDAARLVNKLMDQGFRVTKLATTGGFLKAGNTTLLVGVDEAQLDTVMATIEKVCKSRTQVSAAPTSAMSAMGGNFSPYPIEVMVGGATVFVLTVDQFVKL